MMLSLKVTLSAVAVASSSAAGVPTFTLKELQREATASILMPHEEPSRGARLLRRVASTAGLLAIELDDAYVRDRREALEGVCGGCLGNDDGDDVRRTAMAGSAASRTTLATASIGHDHPMHLRAPAACRADAMDGLRDHVVRASRALIRALDATLVNQQRVLLRTSHGATYNDLGSIVGAANNLEHFHLYEKENKTSATPPVLDWHTDAGLFLAFAPGMVCGSQNIQDDSLWYLDAHGNQVQATFSDNQVGILMGVGAEHWLNSKDFKATKHAVKMLPGQRRAWYGMMHLVPDKAIIQQSPPRTFGDMKKRMTLQTKRRELSVGDFDDSISIGCGSGSDDDIINPVVASARAGRRRVQHVQSAAACNNVTNFFCWMQCLDIPDAELAQGYVNEGFSLYCLDPGALQRTGGSVSQAAEPCEGGWVHNSDCLGSWQPTAPNVPAVPIPVNKTIVFDDSKFCYGGTSMYMDGFHWIHETTCVIYLVPEWVLSTRGKFIGAAFGTILFGMALEVVIFGRRRVMKSSAKKQTNRYLQLGLGGLFYGLQLTMGYLVMLIVMTYSGVLFTCAVLGLVLGNILFNAKGALLAPAPATPEAKEEEKKSGTGGESSSEDDCKPSCCSGKKAAAETSEVAEGATPCCMNSL